MIVLWLSTTRTRKIRQTRICRQKCYTNPNNLTFCFFLDFGGYHWINRDNYSLSEKLFQKSGKDCLALATYFQAVRKMFLDDKKEKHTMIFAPMRPLRFVQHDFSPHSISKTKRISKTYLNNWLPILLFVHGTNRAQIANITSQKINDEFLQTTFNIGIRAIHDHFPELFAGLNNSQSHNWVISIWNKKSKLLQV